MLAEIKKFEDEDGDKVESRDFGMLKWAGGGLEGGMEGTSKSFEMQTAQGSCQQAARGGGVVVRGGMGIAERKELTRVRHTTSQTPDLKTPGAQKPKKLWGRSPNWWAVSQAGVGRYPVHAPISIGRYLRCGTKYSVTHRTSLLVPSGQSGTGLPGPSEPRETNWTPARASGLREGSNSARISPSKPGCLIRRSLRFLESGRAYTVGGH